jgi:hypothetical protein
LLNAANGIYAKQQTALPTRNAAPPTSPNSGGSGLAALTGLEVGRPLNGRSAKDTQAPCGASGLKTRHVDRPIPRPTTVSDRSVMPHKRKGHQQSESEPLPAVVADPSQRHDLVTRRAELTKPALRERRSATCQRITASLYTRPTRSQCPHLLVGRKHRSTKGPAITPLEVTTIRVVPHPRQLAGQRAIEMYRVHDISNVGMLNLGTHATTIEHQQSGHRAGLVTVLVTKTPRNEPNVVR